jgi:hypothetical protein
MGPPWARAGVADIAVNIAAAQAGIINLFINIVLLLLVGVMKVQ